MTLKRYWLEAGTIFFFDKQPDKSCIPRLGQTYTSQSVYKAADVDKVVEELQVALESLIEDKPLPSGEYVHAVYCNGDRKKPPGTQHITCNCKIGLRFQQLQADLARMTAELARVKAANKERWEE